MKIGIDRQSNVEAQQLQAQQLEAQAQQLKKPDLPVKGSFRRALLAGGFVAVIKNESNQDLAVTATMTRPGIQPRSIELVINANMAREIDGEQGWAFVSGDGLQLSNPGFRDVGSPSLTLR